MTRSELIQELLWAYSDRAYSDAELGKKFDVDRTTIHRIRKEFFEDVLGIEFENPIRGKYRIDPKKRINYLPLSPEENLALYVAGRRLQQQTRSGQEHVANALKKLARSLKKPLAEQLVKSANYILSQEQDNQQEEWLSKLVEAWLEGRKVTIRHRKAYQKAKLRTYRVSPILIEPAIWGDGLYLIGYSDYHEGIAKFKVSRIEYVFVSGEPIPDDLEFDVHRLREQAWGIWDADKKPEPVRLKFNAHITPRVKETIWHPSQTIQELDDKSCIWQAEVAEPQEVLPWIRGWGSDVEVLEPDHLRETIKAHVRQAAKTYEIVSQTDMPLTDLLLRLWGKTSKYTEHFHPALYHMFDVAHIAQQLLSLRATSRWRTVLAHTLNADGDTLHEWLPYLVALHDIGKLSPPFQKLNQKQRGRLREEGFGLGRDRENEQHHTIVGRLLLNEYTAVWPPNLRQAFLDMVSGHHGIYRPEEMHDQTDFDFIQEPPEWATLRQHAMQLLKSYLCQQWPEPLPNPNNVSAAIAALNGFCILCDWLGSDGDYFTPKPTTSLPEYVLYSRQKAYERVRDAGLLQTAVSQAPTTFTQLFHDFTAPPRPLQQAIEQISVELLAHPSLTIIEAPTGEGKTEAALLLARRIAAQHGTDEMYIALPTTATSNAMYERITEHLEKRLGLETTVQLIHGQSFLKKDDIKVDSLVTGENPDEDEAAENWFAPKKKALLAPVGVGTIDQAELAALNVRHNALRLIGLAGKTIILDEVHAYDTYMTTIVKRMLNWLSALGSSVILLSATLPQAKRRELMMAYAPNVDTTTVSLATYPNIITLTASDYHTPEKPITVFQPNKTIQLETLTFSDEQAQEKADWLMAQVAEGGCVCWITNTVNRAQDIFKRLPQDADIDLTLLHSRFPLAQRQTIEIGILAKYGKPNPPSFVSPKGGETQSPSPREGLGEGKIINRPPRSIVIGTQVLEQSLDLDFDLMVTDLAPIDLILQRAGRLHRHQRPQAERHTHTQPRLFINMVHESADQYIYSDYILRMTERALQDKISFTLPTDYRELVEVVYTETKPDKKDEDLYAAWDKLDEQAWDLETKANERLADKPLPDYPFYRSAKLQGFSEDEDSTAWTVAQTRWSERETITIIPLVPDGETAVIPTEPSQNIPLTTKATRDQQLHLLRHSLRVSQPKLVATLKAERVENPLPLYQSTLLKNVYPLWLTSVAEESKVFINHDFDQPVYLHPKLGLVFGEYQGE